jgi:hypothetical protein
MHFICTPRWTKNFILVKSGCYKSIKKKWSKNMAKTSTTRRSPLMVKPFMPVEEKKQMDGEIDALFSLTL